MSRNKKALSLLLLCVLVFGVLSQAVYANPSGQENGIPIVENNKASAIVLVAADADERTLEAADTLVEYVKKSTGVQLPIKKESELKGAEHGKRFLFVGYVGTGGDPHALNDLQGMREDGFLIRPHGKTVAIIGPTPIGTEYGVYEFLERYVGVRWLMPGADGEDVPQHNDLSVPRTAVKEEPAYWSRMMYPLQYENVGGNNPVRYEWGVFNRLRNQNGGWEHNVWRFFPPGQYLSTHPEYYPRKDGVPQIPAHYWGWQPCYSNEDTVQIAADWVIQWFGQNPNESAISLAVNDSGNYCEQYPDHPGYTDEKNSIGLPDMSDIYFGWVNKVVAKVLEVYPDKWFGVLAYQEVYDPPSFPLHERVIPYLTKDRMSWSDAAVRAKDQAIVDAWNQKAAHVGFYDYIYGTPYTLPRTYNHLMGDVLKYGKENGAVAFFGELNPNIGEGPKPWLLAKLMWDPNQDVDSLLNEWYDRAVGPEAAPYLKAYFDHWDDFWENRIQQTDWFQSRKNIVYFMYNSASYLSIVTDEEIAQNRTWLETAVAKAQTEPQKKRAELLLRAFEYYEASALSYPRAVPPLADEASALELLAQSADYETSMQYAQKRLTLLDEFRSDPLLVHPWDARTEKMVWSGLNANAFWRLVDYMKANEAAGGAVKQQAAILAGSGGPEAAFANLLLQAVDEGPVNLNASFEELGDPANGKVTAKHWDANILNFGKFERKEEMPATGNSSVYVHDFYYGDINQTVDAKPGLAITRLKYYVTPDTQTVGDIWLELNLLDENGEKLATIRSDQQPFMNSLGRWETIQIMDKIPARVNDVAVKKIQMAAIVNGFFEGGTMYLDDFELYQSANPNDIPLLASAQAGQGTIDVTFNRAPAQIPAVSDFSIQQQSGGEPVTISPTSVIWDDATKRAYLTVPVLPRQPWEQAVQYEVSYQGVDSIRSNAVTVPRLDGYTPVLTNSSFELWTGANPDGWWFWGEGFKRSDTVKRSGQSSLTVDGLYPAQNAAGGGGPVQDMPIQPGHYVGVFHYLTQAQTAGTLTMNLSIRDQNGAHLASALSPTVQASTSNGKWTTVSFEFDVLPTYNGKQTAKTQVLLHMKDFNRGETIYFDDIELIRADDAPQAP
ncbi:DUF4838 domain-containing protein [Paenibacillus contaminans]|uniref:DUF4838 domain-containing protein n=1 Tax=Paenibacillus contaminans TaxID=450362 RepID=A0A329MPM4_9BACL|nr:DUF4838 domain-containing protein [Paenibacillus contaminans]RAV21869.1 hypothetical protein DQG23_07385 [Paenibacillus contaminans]